MKRFFGICLLACLLLLTAGLPAQAAPAKMEIEVLVEDPDTFWNGAYYMSDKTPARPCEVVLEWSAGDYKKTEAVTILKTSKNEGRHTISAEKGKVVDLRLVVTGSKKNEVLATWNIQILNKGQKESISIVPPKTVQPEFNRS